MTVYSDQLAGPGLLATPVNGSTPQQLYVDPLVVNRAIGGRTMTSFGDSRAAFMSLAYSGNNQTPPYPQTSMINSSAMAWAIRLSRGLLSMPLVGYGGNQQGIINVLVVNGGSGYTSPTVTANGAGTGTTFGAPVVVNGVIVSVPVTAQGYGWSSLPSSFTVTDSSGSNGSGAVLQGVVGGSGNFGVPGENTNQMVNRLNLDPLLNTAAAIAAIPADIVVIYAGTNDFLAGIPAATTKANLKVIFERFTAAGKTVVYIPDHARSAWSGASATLITTLTHRLYDVRRWARRYASQDAAINPGRFPRLLIVDVIPETTDAASATGNPIAGSTIDGLHDAPLKGYALGYKLFQALSPMLGIAGGSPGRDLSQADVYDATDYPSGAQNTNFLFGTVTGGTAVSPCTGTAPGNFYFTRSGGSATGTASIGVESPRTDGFTGNRLVLTFSLGGGTNAEQYSLYAQSGARVALSSLGMAPGDIFLSEMDLELSGVALINYLRLAGIFFDASSGGNLVGQVFDGDNQRTAQILPSSTPGLGLIPGFSPGVPFTMRTPGFVIPATATHLNCMFNIGFDASGAAGSATAVAKISNFQFRKVA